MNKETTILLSYPRSGNFWTRKVIEILTGIPTSIKMEGADQTGFRTGYDVLDEPPFVFKKHFTHQIDQSERTNRLIVLMRNYKECTLRHAGGSNLEEQLNEYLNILELYDGWECDKLLLCYEDIITSPKEEFSKLKEFLEVDDEHFNGFFDNYETHKNKSVRTYHAGSQTRGEHTLFHSNKVSAEQRKSMDNHLIKKNPQVFERYLKRYEEKD